MGLLVTATAQIRCTFGSAPAVLEVAPTGVLCGGKAVATIEAIAPDANVQPFGMCSSEANPTVSDATAAADGVLTPMPCVPAVAGLWASGSPTVLVGGIPALTQPSKCLCTWGGLISILAAGQQGTQIG